MLHRVGHHGSYSMCAITRLNQSLLIKIGNIINTFLPMRNKLVYSYSMEICASGFNELFENVFCILVAVEAFSPTKSCGHSWRSGSQLARGQVTMEDEENHSTFEVLVVWHLVWYYHGEELDPYCWPVLAASIAALRASCWFAEHTSMQWFYWDSEKL